MNRAKKYCSEIISGEIPSPENINLACQRFLSLCDKYEYKPEEGDRWVKFIEKYLCHWQGEWARKPLLLEDWQVFILHSLFALYDGERRLVTNAYIQVPRKNAKTTLAAAIALGHIFIDNVNAPQVLVGANNEDQAKICTTCAGKIIEESPVSRAKIDKSIKLYKYREKIQSINYLKNNGEIMPMSRDLKTKDGFNPSLGIIDEYHEAPTSGLLDVIRSGQGARLNSLLLTITTAGFNKYGPCYQNLRRVSIDILKGKKEDDSQFSLIYEPDEDDDWENPETWQKVNPNFNVSVYPHFLKGAYTEAKNEGGTKEVNFKTKNLNLWTDASDVWIQDHIWMKGNIPVQSEGKKWYLGIDMAYKRDFTAIAYISEPDHEGIYDVLPYFWIPEDTVKDKIKEESASMLQWINDGLIYPTPGNTTDHEMVADFIIKKNNELETIMGIADPAHAIFVINNLNRNGIECQELPQSASRLTPSIGLMYELAMNGKIRHGGNPVLRWMLGNCILKTYTNDLVQVTKEFDNQKIDGIDAMINAFYPFAVKDDDEPQFYVGLL